MLSANFKYVFFIFFYVILGHYIFTGWNDNNPVSSVVSGTFNPLSKEQCLEVWYYMKSRRLDCELNIFFNEEGLGRRQSRRFAWKGIKMNILLQEIVLIQANSPHYLHVIIYCGKGFDYCW